jgi:23S rRNA (cytidine1920-2'-O)/16S rRNA (cytidine1409-2'-O)-methyltransferase
VDRLLVERGLCESRARAAAAIAEGRVRLAGRLVEKPGERAAASAALEVAGGADWVSRAALKLVHALALFGVEPAGRVCLDVGASTGGFTEVLLARGAVRVFAVDVGRDQLHARLRADSRVACLEGQDARTLEAHQISPPAELVVCDASFIGADKVLARPFHLAAAAAEAVVLIKPPYEAGPGVRVRDEGALEIAQAASARLDGLEGFRLLRLEPSALRGGDGALEFIAHLVRGGA